MVTHDPLHRSQRAEVPHWAPTSGINAKPLSGIRMADPGRREPAADVAPHSAPGHPVLLAAASQRSAPQAPDFLPERPEGRSVHGHAVVAHVTRDDRPQVGPLLRDGMVHTEPKLGLHRLQFRLPPLAHRLATHRELPLPGRGTAVRETQEVEGLGLPQATPATVLRRKAAELEQARLVGVQFQAEASQALAQVRQEPLGFVPILESHHEIVGETHHDDLTAGGPASPLVDPLIERVVQVEVAQQRADTPALDRPLLATDALPILQHAGFEPFLDQAHDAPVSDAVLEEFHQPRVIEGLEEPAQIGVEHPVHLLPQQPDRKRVQRIVLAAPRPEAVGETEKIRLVDRGQYLDDGTLDDLVLQRRDSERPRPPVRLRDVRSLDRFRPVRSPLQPRGQILKVLLQVLPVRPPRHPINARGCVALQRKVRRAQSLQVVDVVVERGESLTPISSRCLTDPLQRTVRVAPALRPGRVLLARIPLGQPPFLHRLRRRSPGFVRRLPRYYGAVRLPPTVHHRRASLDFPMRSADPLSTDGWGTSRFPRKVLPSVHGVSDRAGAEDASRYRRPRCGLPLISTASAPRGTHRSPGRAWFSRLNTRPARSPVNASSLPLRTTPHDSGPVWVATPSPYDSFIHYTLPV